MLVVHFGLEFQFFDKLQWLVLLWYSLRWYFLRLNDIRWQIHITHGLCRFRNQYALCRLIPCRFRHCVGWSHFPPWIARIPPEHHKILKTHRILIIFLYFMGNYVACKNCTQKKKSLHTFHELPFLINCKNLCRFWHGHSTWRNKFYCSLKSNLTLSYRHV